MESEGKPKNLSCVNNKAKKLGTTELIELRSKYFFVLQGNIIPGFCKVYLVLSYVIQNFSPEF